MSKRDVGKDVLERLHVSRESAERLEIYANLLLQWQGRINLIGPSTIDDVWKRHIADGWLA